MYYDFSINSISLFMEVMTKFYESLTSLLKSTISSYASGETSF